MERLFTHTRRALAGVALAWALARCGVGFAQETPPPPPDPIPAELGEPPAVGDPGACAAEAGERKEGAQEPPSPWSKVPPVRPVPRPGMFILPPTGPGYYSFRDFLEGDYRQKPPIFPYPPYALMMASFFDADFRYLDSPDNEQHDLFDGLKRQHLGDCWMLTVGGEERLRFMNEVDSQLSGRNNQYELLRSRFFGDLWYLDRFRLYAEFIDAQIFNEDLPPLPPDQNHTDLQNLFIDVKAGELGDRPVYVRAGRQELLYGSQRLISPPDWANTRRTFEGVKVFRQGENFDVDLFWVQPVIPSPGHFDSVDDGQNFTGVWTTYRPKKGTYLDLYYLNLDQAKHVAIGKFNEMGGFNVSTLGSRFAGDYEHVLFDFEGMYQVGSHVNQSISAGAATAGLGYDWADVRMRPQVWVYYDYASGDHNPGAGNFHGTFNQLFPFGHYYFGYLDLVGRENIHDLSLQAACYPTPWILAGAQFHHFRLDSDKDALYNFLGVPIRRDPTGQAGGDVGNELDLFANFHLGTHQDLLVGYSKLFAGNFIKQTGSPLSPELFYFQYCFRY
jgi:Alginate export